MIDGLIHVMSPKEAAPKQSTDETLESIAVGGSIRNSKAHR